MVSSFCQAVPLGCGPVWSNSCMNLMFLSVSLLPALPTSHRQPGLGHHPLFQVLRNAPISVGSILVGQAGDVTPQCSPKDHLRQRPPPVLVWCVPVLKDGLHELVVVDASSPLHTILKHPLGRLDCCLSSVVAVGGNPTHHLWSSICGDVFRYVPCGTEVPHDSNQVLAINFALWG